MASHFFPGFHGRRGSFGPDGVSPVGGMWRRMAGCLLVGGLVLVAGCAKSGEKLYPVKGKISVDGKPADGAILLFHPQGGGQVSTATADANGNYACVHNTAPGIPTGKYTITVSWPDPAKRNATSTAMGQTPDVPDLLRGKYAMRERSTLTIDVTPTTTELPPIEIDSK